MMVMEFKGVIPALLGNRIDAGVSGPLCYAGAHAGRRFHSLRCRRQSDRSAERQSEKISGRDRLCGVKAAVPVNTAFEASTKTLSAECKSAGKQEIDILSLTGSDTVALASQQGRVDAALNFTATIAAMFGETLDAYELAGPPCQHQSRAAQG
jgi:ABC-type amino acid transport substrate-binding protein